MATIGLTLLLASCSNGERDSVRRDGAYVNPADYDQSCTAHSDCAIVTTRFNCVWGWSCPSDAVSVDAREAFESELERQRQLCDDPDASYGDQDCHYGQRPAAVCAEQRCTFVEDVSCLQDADCDRPYGDSDPGWALPENARCVEFQCRECEGEPYQTSECPDGYTCRRYPDERVFGVCEALAPCEDASDCGRDPYYGTQFGCRDAVCTLCDADADCGADQFCQSEEITLALPPNAGDVPGYHIPLGCYAQDAIDASCLDGSCPTWCEPAEEGTLRCTEQTANPYPGVEFPELSDFDTSCSADNDCTEVSTHRWSDACECRCDEYSLNTSSAATYEAAWPETKTRYGCDAEPDCACPDLTAYCLGGQCLIR